MATPEAQSAGSVSRIECVASVVGKGPVMVSFYRHLCPLTVNAFLRALPMESRVSVQPAMVSMFTSIRVGVEKPKTSFQRGEAAFLASGGLLCFFLKAATSERPLNPMGKVDEGLELLDGLRPGGVIRLSQRIPQVTG